MKKKSCFELKRQGVEHDIPLDLMVKLIAVFIISVKNGIIFVKIKIRTK